MGIGAHDLAGGLGLLKELQERHNTTWLSMNLVDPEKKEPVFTPYLITEVGGLKIALLGLTDDQGGHNDEDEQDKGYIVLPWQDLLPQTLAEVKKKVDLTILLSSYSYEVNKEIAETVDGLHMILESGHAAPTTEPYPVENTLIAQTGTRGKYLGMMRIEWNKAGKWSEPTRNSSPDNDTCKYINQFIPLNTSLPEDPEVKKIIDQTIQKVNEINKKRISRAGLNQPLLTLQDVAGSEKCQECHADQMKIWQDSRHAQAWTTLEKKNQQFNEDCLLCHVTLPFYDADRVKAGNLLLMMPKTLKNIGCEACHGPGAAHSAGKGKIPAARPDEKVCLQCHTPEHDDNFIFSDKARKLKCSSAQETQQAEDTEKELPEQGKNNGEDIKDKAPTEPELTEQTEDTQDAPDELVIRPRKKKTAHQPE